MMAEQKPMQQEQLRGPHLDLQVEGRNTEDGLKPQMQGPMGAILTRTTTGSHSAALAGTELGDLHALTFRAPNISADLSFCSKMLKARSVLVSKAFEFGRQLDCGSTQY